ncbi:MAG: aminotransferase class V-fold PLP-dependent enzyme [Halieaceae bacterium]|jgi:selenocysteine lyase/cysteine desulfurase|nr:aminotransferase class V-fold PLP-dependent enzyme [Halieaceae bacterium]
MPTSRREFFGLIGAGAIAAAAGVRAQTQSSREVRSAFAFADDRVPMNAANLCPSPVRVAEAVTRYTAMIDADCSFQNRAQFAVLRETSREAVAAMLGVSADEVALLRNTSEANNVISAGLDLTAGDEVLLWEQNHSSNNVSWAVRAARGGFSVRRVSVPAKPSSVQDLLDPFLAAVSERTRVLTVTHISNVSGLKLPIAELGALCRERGIHFHIDGAQSWGASALDLAAIGCDSFSASAHKWFLGPKEVGILYVREDALERVWPSVVSYDWGDDAISDLVGARKFESMGQRDDAALAAIADAAKLHAQLGAAAVEAHITSLSTQLKEGLLEAGIPLLTPLSPAFSGGVCIAAIPREQRSAIFEGLYREHGIIAAPTGGLRLCPHIYNTAEHVERAVRGASELHARLS